MFAQAASNAVGAHGAQQRPFELAELGRLLAAYDVRRVLEVGTCYGGTAWFLAEIGLEVTAVDVDLSQLRQRDPRVTYLGDGSQQVEPSGWDAVFIDGDHSYGGTRADWERFRGSRIVAFHDILLHENPDDSYVDRLWGEIKPGLRTLEIVGGVGWGGIGAVISS